jgi:T3SS negative regulator,GrlR
MEGIWHAHFTSGSNQGDGVAVLRNGEVLGGDPAHTYYGSYQEDGKLLYANIRVAPYTAGGLPADIDHAFSLFLRGSVTGQTALMSGHSNNHPEAVVRVELHKDA